MSDDPLYERLREQHFSPECGWPSIERAIRKMIWQARRTMLGREARHVLAMTAYDLAVALSIEGRDVDRLVRYAYVVNRDICKGLLEPRPRRKRAKVAV